MRKKPSHRELPPRSRGRTIVIDKTGKPKALDTTPKPLKGAKARKQARRVAWLMRPAQNDDDVD